MKKNMGQTDKAIRIGIALILLIGIYLEWVDTPWSIVLLIASGVFVLTSFVSFCPLYTILGINTCKTKK